MAMTKSLHATRYMEAMPSTFQGCTPWKQDEVAFQKITIPINFPLFVFFQGLYDFRGYMINDEYLELWSVYTPKSVFF